MSCCSSLNIFYSCQIFNVVGVPYCISILHMWMQKGSCTVLKTLLHPDVQLIFWWAPPFCLLSWFSHSYDFQKFNWLSIITPVSFSYSTCFSSTSFSLYVLLLSSLLLIDIDIQLSGLNSNCYWSAHFNIVSTFLWTVFWSSESFIFLNIVVSSANKNISEFTCYGRSFINITNSNGPSRSPWIP